MESNFGRKVFTGKGPMVALVVVTLLLMLPYAFAQETTAAVQGTVKDPSGAVISQAKVEVTGALPGSKTAETDSAGYYRIVNLPPGTYTMTVTKSGFQTWKRTGVVLDVGRQPTIDVSMKVGATEQVVEVTGETPIVDVTTSKTAVSVTRDIYTGIPKGRSFQSLIPFAPGARQEPLTSNNIASGRTGGFQIDGA